MLVVRSSVPQSACSPASAQDAGSGRGQGAGAGHQGHQPGRPGHHPRPHPRQSRAQLHRLPLPGLPCQHHSLLII